MKIRIDTTQNVHLEYEIAGIGYRFIAALLDLLIMIGYVIFAATIISQLDNQEWGVFAGLLIPLVIYHPVCEIFLDGQSIGKKAMKLKVVKIDGSQPTVGDYLLRWLLWIVEANPFFGIFGLASIGIVSIVVTRYGQRIGDLAAGTTVVRLVEETSELHSIFAPTGEGYTPEWPQAAILNDRDISIIRSGFEAVDKGADDAILSQIAYRVADVLSVERGNIGTPASFLKRVITDYNHIAGQTA